MGTAGGYLSISFIICIQCKPRSCLLFAKLFVACIMFRIILISTQNNKKFERILCEATIITPIIAFSFLL